MRHFTLTGNGLKNFREDLIKDWYDECELTLNRITVTALLSLAKKGIRYESRDKRNYENQVQKWQLAICQRQ